MRSVIYFLLQPIVIGLLLLIICRIAHEVWQPKLFKKWYLPGVIWLVLTGISPIPWWTAKHMEQIYPVLQNIENPTEKVYILVLGSGHTQDVKLKPLHQTSTSGIARLTEGIRQYIQMDSAYFVTSGYAKRSPVSQAEVMADAAISLGVNPLDTLHLPQTKTTIEEIESFIDRFGNKSRIVLVTSALHMPRAVRIANSRGLSVWPAPCDFIAKKAPYDPINIGSFSGQNFITSDRVIHEWAGKLYLWINPK